jgi:uncharacterized protein YebE (UPF0316 family)|tara:strand:+ start:374 stop:889 length:516 start_codon:yes stop_codon:yes gene_type:complete
MNIFLAVIYVFLLRLIEQALGTLRSLYVNKGKPKLGALLGFIESAIWVVAISQVIKDLNDPLLIIGYALGFAAGTISGSYIESTIAIGNVVVRVFIERNENSELLANELRANDFGVTVINGQGRDGEVSIAWCVVPRKKVKELLNIVSEITPDAYVTTEATNPTNISSNNK